MKNIFKLIASILMCQAAGIAGSFFTTKSVDTWYAGINKPVFTPPDWVFAPVWSILYILMGISLFLIWRKGLGSGDAKSAFFIFIFQLLLNSLWSFAFFGLRSPLAGLIVILILWLAILWTIISFRKISLPAALLLIPYTIWVSFATLLNWAIFLLNR